MISRRRALMAAQGGADPGPNYIVPSNSAGRGTSVATFTDGNLVHVTTFSKGADNDIRGYFARAISIKSGDTVRVKTTRKSGTFSGTAQTFVHVGGFTINEGSSVSWSTSAAIDVSATAASAYSAGYVRFRNSSNARTGNNDSNLVEIFINGEQVI